MKRMVWVRWMVGMVLVLLIGGMTATASAGDLRRIVVFRDGTLVAVQQQVVALSGGTVLHTLYLINALAIQLPAIGTDAALAFLQAQPTVQRVDGDPLIGMQQEGADGEGADGARFVTSAPAPSREFYSWGIDWIGAADIQAQNPWLGGDGVKVALLDTGVDPTHPDLRQNLIGGYNAMAGQNPNNWGDDNGHGTHVAGTLAARLNNLGVIGVAPRVQIYVFKILDQYGQGRTSDVINALQRVTPDMRIITMSAGTDLAPPSFENAIHRLYQAGKLMMFSAGNSCTFCTPTPPTDIKYPARYSGVIAVGASDANDQVPGFSRSGPAMANHGVVAPGVNIFSTNLGGGYGTMSGTSTSTPHVTGVVTLALQLQPNLSYEALLALLHKATQVLSYPPEQQGAGRIDVEKLVYILRNK